MDAQMTEARTHPVATPHARMSGNMGARLGMHTLPFETRRRRLGMPWPPVWDAGDLPLQRERRPFAGGEPRQRASNFSVCLLMR
jgi:hypothetical protein